MQTVTGTTARRSRKTVGDLALLGLPTRAVNALAKAGITSHDALAALSDLQLAAISGMGPETLAAVRTRVPAPQPVVPDGQRAEDGEQMRRQIERVVRQQRARRQQRRAEPAARSSRPGGHARPNLRGKKTVQARMSVPLAAALDAAWLAYRAPYARTKSTEDPSQVWALSKSNFTAAALDEALRDPGAWILDTANDGRYEPGQHDETERVAFLLPAVLVDRLADVVGEWNQRYVEGQVAVRPGKYRLTRANVIVAALQAVLGRAGEWYLTAANDDRLSGLAPDDRRTDPALWNRRAG
jgi:hypothetical protein